MKYRYLILIILSIQLIQSCQQKKKSTLETETTTKQTNTKVETILEKTLKAHGDSLYITADYLFEFRGNTYQFKNTKDTVIYIKTIKNGNSVQMDQLKNGKFSRVIDGQEVKLDSKAISSATGSLNSVLYFATLPHKLTDAAVIKTYIGETTIRDNNYDLLKITFKQEGGGEDFDDVFMYWIHQDSHTIDYLAYSYHVNKGGIRFRSAYNRRNIEGILFQDYVNYKADLNTPLESLGKLYEDGKLEEMSKIETESVRSLKIK